MHFAILGITGHTGAAAADTLLQSGHTVRALVRNPAKAAAWAERGVALETGDFTDAAAIARTMAGVDGAYVLIPPQWGVPDMFAANAPIIAAILEAIGTANVPRVVVLSSVAAHLEAGTGPIRGLRPLEAGLADRPGVTFLRAAYFQENLGSGLEPAAKDGVLPVFWPKDLALEMVATRDIGAEVARQLAIPAAEAPRIVNLAGPAPQSFHDVAETLSTLLERPVSPLELPPAALTETLRGMGAGHLAELYAEMSIAGRDGRLAYPDGEPVTRGATPVEATLTAMLGRG